MTAAPEAERLVIDQPGVYDGISADDYHADPVPGGSLSSSEVRRLLPPSCPALFRHYRTHPEQRVPTRAMEFGSAAHALILEDSASAIVEVDAENYQTKAAQTAARAARLAGRIPLLPNELAKVRAMAAALKANPLAVRLLERGRAERSLFWTDPQTGVWRRARLDWSRDPVRGRRVIVPDYKTCNSAEPRAFAKAVYDKGYHVQAAWYLDAVRDLGEAGPDAAFLFIAQEKTAPYVVTVFELDADALALGHALSRAAIDLYLRCTESGRWPGYSDDIVRTSLPPWAANDLEAVL